jgi:hypothetical protein
MSNIVQSTNSTGAVAQMIPVTVSIDSYGGLYIGNPPDKPYKYNATDGFNGPGQPTNMIPKLKAIEDQKAEDRNRNINNKKNGMSKDTTTSISNIPEVFAYDVIYDQDPDILNQGSFSHIQKYFERKEREANESTDVADNIVKYNMTQRNIDPRYSINSVNFFIKAVVIILVLWILWEFIDQK